MVASAWFRISGDYLLRSHGGWLEVVVSRAVFCTDHRAVSVRALNTPATVSGRESCSQADGADWRFKSLTTEALVTQVEPS